MNNQRISIALAATLVASGLATAGTYSEPAAPPPSTYSSQSPTWEWFIGGSGGYLLDLEEDMYHGHIGVNTTWAWSGWSTAIFLEGGFVETNEVASIIDPTVPTAIVTVPVTSELQIVPVTLNFKLQKELTSWLNIYFGVGAGVAFTEFEGFAPFAGPGGTVEDDDTVFYAQAFAGLGFDVTDNFEIFTGARWIYMDDPEFTVGPGGSGIGFEDDVLVEAGLRFSF